MRTSYYSSIVGMLRISMENGVLYEVSFTEEEGEEIRDSEFSEVNTWLDCYFKGEKPMVLPTLHISGTSFQKRVYEILLSIPYGESMTYGAIASILARERGIAKMSAQAIGQAVTRNPIAILVPCHRVLGKDSVLTGYGGGIEKKRILLDLEQIPYTE